MSDIAFQAAKRAYKANPSIDTKKEWLKQSLRTGTLEKGRVFLASWFFDKASSEIDGYWESDHITGICPCPGCLLDDSRYGLSGWFQRSVEHAKYSTPGIFSAFLVRLTLSMCEIVKERQQCEYVLKMLNHFPEEELKNLEEHDTEELQKLTEQFVEQPFRTLILHCVSELRNKNLHLKYYYQVERKVIEEISKYMVPWLLKDH